MSELEIYDCNQSVGSYNYQKAYLLVQRRNEFTLGVGDRQAPTELYKSVVIENTPQMAGINHTPVEHTGVKKHHMVQVLKQLQQGWYQYHINTGQFFSCPVMEKLQELFSLGQQQNKWRVSGDISLEIIITERIGADWSQNIDLTVPNTNALFQLPSKKIIDLKNPILRQKNIFNNILRNQRD